MTDAAPAVAILGHGAMGRTMERLLSERCRVRIWDLDPETGKENRPLGEALEGAGFVVFALPAKPHEKVAQQVLREGPADALWLTVAKGLDARGRTPMEAMEAAGGERERLALLYGPMIAEELFDGRAGFADLACDADGTFERVRALFRGGPLHVRRSRDMDGTSWGVILKNVYVPLIGFADGLECGDNVRGFLVAGVLEELDRIVQAMGGEAGTAYGLAGLADLVTTATSPDSHHRGVGVDIARGRHEGIRAEGKWIRTEGFHTLLRARERGLIDPAKHPFYRAAERVAEGDGEPRAIIGELIDHVFE